MTLKDLAQMFNRSLLNAFELKKFLLMFLTLVLSGVLVLFFQALALYVMPWLQFALRYIPLFLVIGLLMAAGILLIRLYVKEMKGETISLAYAAKHSWDVLLKASYLALPLLGIFLVFWVCVGLLMLLKSIPYAGVPLGIVLAFIPFLLNLGILMLLVTALCAFFFVSPALAVEQEVERARLYQTFKSDIFTHLLLLVIACIPVYVVWKFLNQTLLMTFHFYAFGDHPMEQVLQSAVMLLPFAAILTPAIIFFFHFAYESYKREGSEAESTTIS